MIELIVKKDEREINRYFLPQGSTTLGRAEDNAIILDDSCVSRRHARIKVDGGKVTIEDLGSGNGTYQGDQRVEKVELRDGDEVMIEPFMLQLRLVSEKNEEMGRTRPVQKAGAGPASERLAPPPPAKRTPGGSAAGGVRLEVVRGQGGPYLLPDDDEATIGRSDEAKLTLRDPSASRLHAAISHGGRGWTVRDLDSANGTYVNGSPVKEAVLTDGDILLIGNTELRFTDPSASARPVAEVTPPPSTGPVTRRPGGNGGGGRKPAAPPPPRRREPDPEPMYDAGGGGTGGGMEMPMYGDSSGGALPMDEPHVGGGTEVGPPPSAFGDTGTGEAPQADYGGGYGTELGGGGGGGNGYGYGGGNGMELGDGGMFPGAERPPDSLLGKYIYSLKHNGRTRLFTFAGLFIFGLFAACKIMSNKNAGQNHTMYEGDDANLPENVKMSLNSMREFDRNGKDAVSKADYGGAFEAYGKILNPYGQKPELSDVGPAQDLIRNATSTIFALHEVLLIQRMEDATNQAAQLVGQQKARFDHDMTEGRAKFDNGMKRSAVKDLELAIKDFGDALSLDPNNAEAKDKRDQANQKRNSILHIVAASNAAEKAKQAGSMFQDAMNAKAQRHYEVAVDKFQRVVDYDPGNETGFGGQASQQIQAIKNMLAQQAAPYREQGKAAKQRQDFLAARKAYRQAITVDPYDQTLVLELQPIQNECEKSAKYNIQAANAYLSADNCGEARKALAEALKYADQDTDPEYQKVQNIKTEMSRSCGGGAQ